MTPEVAEIVARGSMRSDYTIVSFAKAQMCNAPWKKRYFLTEPGH
jgi:hypothetical protein